MTKDSQAPLTLTFLRSASPNGILVSLDLDFANPLRFDPTPTPGIAVLRVPDLPGRSDLIRAATVLCDAMARAEITGRLWVVDQTRVRQYEPGDG